MRNAVKRVTHKERAQPSDRKKFGILEKHKDYIERATDFKNKQKHLQRLRIKASERNEDEFYNHMHNAQIRNGKHTEVKKTSIDKETIDLLKTQDMGYIVHKKQVDEKKIERLLDSIHLVGVDHKKHHKVFLDSAEEVERFDPAVHFCTEPELINRAHNRLRSEQLLHHIPQSLLEESNNDGGSKKRKAAMSGVLREIKERSKRAKRLGEAMNELALQRKLATSKGAKKKIVVTKQINGKGRKEKVEKEIVIYKWKRQRAT